MLEARPDKIIFVIFATAPVTLPPLADAGGSSASSSPLFFGRNIASDRIPKTVDGGKVNDQVIGKPWVETPN